MLIACGKIVDNTSNKAKTDYENIKHRPNGKYFVSSIVCPFSTLYNSIKFFSACRPSKLQQIQTIGYLIYIART